jgi:hypothetical protein
MPSRREAGGVLVYVAVFLSLLTLGIALLVAVNGRSGPAVTGTMVIAGIVVLAGLRHEIRRDLDAALTFCAVCAIAVAIVGGIVVLSIEPRPAGWIAVTAVAAVVGLGLGFYTFRRQRSPGSADFPDLLRQRYPAEQIFETDLIQFTGAVVPSNGRSPHSASLLLQNCSDGQRSVTIHFEAGEAAKYLRFHPSVEADLGPAEVVRINVPVISPTYEGSYPLYFSLSVRGSGGRRVRTWRAQAATRRIKGAETVALLAVGHLAAGGGVRFTIGPTPVDLWNTVLANPIREVLWQPGTGLTSEGLRMAS